MAFRNHKLQDQFSNILNTFTGADGGIRFAQFRFMLERLETQVDDYDDPHAEKLLEIVGQFSRMIDAASGGL